MTKIINSKATANQRKRAAINYVLSLGLEKNPYSVENVKTVQKIQDMFKVTLFVGLHGVSAWTARTPIVTWHA